MGFQEEYEEKILKDKYVCPFCGGKVKYSKDFVEEDYGECLECDRAWRIHSKESEGTGICFGFDIEYHEVSKRREQFLELIKEELFELNEEDFYERVRGILGCSDTEMIKHLKRMV